MLTLLAPLVSAGLLWLCHFPVAWGWLAWIALAPLLTLSQSLSRPWLIYLSTYLGGLAFYWPALQWMCVADERMIITWAALATYCAVYWPLALYGIRLLRRRAGWPLLLAAPVVWTALEYTRSNLATGFSWYLLAHTQHDHLYLIQIADISGAWGVSFLVVLVNALLCECWLKRRLLWSRTLVVALMLVAVVTYGFWRLGQTDFAEGPRLALIQGNLPQQIRNNPTTADSAVKHYVALSDCSRSAQPHLIVWPETSMPEDWEEVWPGGPMPRSQSLASDSSTRFKTAVLFGLNATVVGPDRVGRRFNSALLIDGEGNAVARYDKIHRVPFGEYVPLRDWLPFMNYLAPYDFDYSVSPGLYATRFKLRYGEQNATFGVMICYEDSDPDTSRPYGGGDGRPIVDFLLNTSNDGWFDGTCEHDEHLAICRFRAIENRRSVARAVNMGISALIDPNGRVLQPRPLQTQLVTSGVGPEKVEAGIWEVDRDSPPLAAALWSQFKKVPCVILATVPLDGRGNLYALWGDWLPWLCWLSCGLALGICRLRSSAGRAAAAHAANG